MDYIQTLEYEYQKRKQKNERYSLRAFSNFLGVQSSTLSAVFKKNRHLSLKDAEEVAERLFGQTENARQFIMAYQDEKAKASDERFVSDSDDFFPVLADWEYGAILVLMETKDFSENPKWIAQRLNLLEERVISVLSHLEKVGLILRNEKGQLEKTHKSFQTSEDVNSLALKEAHEKELELAQEKHLEIDILDREYGSITLAIEKSKIPHAKKRIREFVDQLERSFETENADEVYMFTYQLFPLTNIEDKKESYQ